MSPQNPYVEIIMPKVMILGGWVFDRCIGHEGEALMNGISVIIKETLQSSLATSACEDTRRNFQLRRGPPPDPDLGLPASTTVRNTFLLFIRHPVCNVLL